MATLTTNIVGYIPHDEDPTLKTTYTAEYS